MILSIPQRIEVMILLILIEGECNLSIFCFRGRTAEMQPGKE